MDEEILQWWGFKDGGGDPITSTWPGVSSVVYPLSGILIYLGLVHTYRQRTRLTPISGNLKQYLTAYNLFQVIFSGYIFMETVITAWSSKYNIWCEPPHSTLSQNGRRMAIASWLFYISKYIDLMDTFFIILKGNKHQISVLHVFHHSSMLLNSWMGIRHAPTGHSFFIHLANSFVHISMYSYYFLSSLGKWVKPYLWWKQYLTQMQIIQFIMIIVHLLYGYVHGCLISRPIVQHVCLYLVILIMFFSNFYIQTYFMKGQPHNKATKNGRLND